MTEGNPRGMKRLMLALLLVLSACAPTATLTPDEEVTVQFVQLPSGDLALTAPLDIEHADIRVGGLDLTIDSPRCPDPCVPSEDGFYRLIYPDEAANYGTKLEVDVTGGVIIRGRALVTLVGADETQPVPLEVAGDS